MRITFVLPYAGMSGGIRVIGIYAQYLKDHGHDVVVVSARPGARRVRSKIKRFLTSGSLGQVPHRQCFLDQFDLDWRLARRPGPVEAGDVPDSDVVIATWWETAALVRDLPASKGKKSYFMQDYGTRTQPLENVVPTWRMGLPMITISEWLQSLIFEHAPDASVRLVPNGVDQELFHDQDGETRVDQVGVVYNGLPSKRIDLAIEAVRIARERVEGLSLVLIGQPKTEFPSFVKASGRVSDTELRSIYASSKAWIFPSQIEGFGLPILESMACGTPVIATPAGAAPELLRDGGGRLVPHNDPASMANAIIETVRMPETDWLDLSRQAKSVAAEHTWEKACSQFEAAITDSNFLR